MKRIHVIIQEGNIIMNSKPSEQDIRIKYLVKNKIITDKQIIDLFALLKSKFKKFISNYPDISINLASMYFSNSMLSKVQKFKYDLDNQSKFGGSYNHAKSISSAAENAKILLLPTSIMLYSINNNDNNKIQNTCNSFKQKPFDVLIQIKKFYDWLFPEIEKINIIRNSEYHHSTEWHNKNNNVTFVCKNKPPLTMDFSELHIIGIQFIMGYLLLNIAQFKYFFINSAFLLFDKIKGNKDIIKEYLDFETLLTEAHPSKEDIKILTKLDIIIQHIYKSL